MYFRRLAWPMKIIVVFSSAQTKIFSLADENIVLCPVFSSAMADENTGILLKKQLHIIAVMKRNHP
jgi:hypothetical protein